MEVNKGDIIKHGSFMDVALLIKDVNTLNENELTITAVWMNQGMTNTRQLIPVPFQMTIHKDDKTLWFKCKNPNAPCIRYEQWEQFRSAA